VRRPSRGVLAYHMRDLHPRWPVKHLANVMLHCTRGGPFRHPLLKLRAGIASALFYGAFRLAAVRIAERMRRPYRHNRADQKQGDRAPTTAALPQVPSAHFPPPRHTHGASRNPRTLLVSDAGRRHLAERAKIRGYPRSSRDGCRCARRGRQPPIIEGEWSPTFVQRRWLLLWPVLILRRHGRSPLRFRR
jgi:hypothetical protein